MKNSLKIASLVVAGLMVVGCNKKEEATSPTTPPTETKTNGVTGALNNAANSAKETASEAASKTKEAAKDATAAVKDKAADASSALGDTTTKALDQVKTYVAGHKYDLADAALKPVEARKASLPETVQKEVASLREQVDAGKAAEK